MSNAKFPEIFRILQHIVIPYVPSVTLADICTLESRGDRAVIQLKFGLPLHTVEQILNRALVAALGEANIEADVEWLQEIPAGNSGNCDNTVEGVKNIIAVASGKGGVGKSTTAVNLALALVAEGAKVGLLDADIYGPSQPQMLGVADKRPEMYAANLMEPIPAQGLKLVSMGNLVTEATPMVWRGPMVSGALQQLLRNTHWGDLDYLVIDMPPGTGDIQLTLSQSVPVTGAVIVTTPQDIALLDAKKGIEMFRKVNIPIFGVVENMSTHVCSNCGHKEAIFGEAGGDALAVDYDTSVLGRLPLALAIREHSDSGKPSVVADPDSDIALEYTSIALGVASAIWLRSMSAVSAPIISISDD